MRRADVHRIVEPNQSPRGAAGPARGHMQSIRPELLSGALRRPQVYCPVMAAPFDRPEYDRWMEMARETVASAERDLTAGDYNWAAFKAHQAGEMALKAFLRGMGKPVVGHDLTELIHKASALGLPAQTDHRTAANGLDDHYITARYPDAYAAGTPSGHYNDAKGRRALADARLIIDLVVEARARI